MNAILLPFSVVVSFPLLYFWPRIVRPLDQLRNWKECAVVAILFIVLGGLQVAEYFIFMSYCVELVPGAPMNFGSSLLFPLSLAILLYLYIAHRRATFRFVCVYLLVINGSVASCTCILRQEWAGAVVSDAIRSLCTVDSTYAVVWGTVLLFIDIGVMVGAYRLIKPHTASHIWRLAIPLLLAVLFDSVWFSAIIAHLTNSTYYAVLFPHLASKAIMSFLYAVCLALHFKWHDQALIDENAPENPLAFLLSVIGLGRLFTSAASESEILTSCAQRGNVRHGSNGARSGSEERICMEDAIQVFLRDLKTPRAVKEMVDLLGPTPARRQDEEDRFKLSFYYGGYNIAYRQTDRGIEILASGRPEQVAAVIDELGNQESEGLIIDCPEPFKKYLREIRDLPRFRER